MGAAKYRVSQIINGKEQFYGHYAGENEQVAINKAIKSRTGYNSFDFSKPFRVKRLSVEKEVMYEG